MNENKSNIQTLAAGIANLSDLSKLTLNLEGNKFIDNL